jgi:hypothetical protein
MNTTEIFDRYKYVDILHTKKKYCALLDDASFHILQMKVVFFCVLLPKYFLLESYGKSQSWVSYIGMKNMVYIDETIDNNVM